MNLFYSPNLRRSALLILLISIFPLVELPAQESNKKSKEDKAARKQERKELEKRIAPLLEYSVEERQFAIAIKTISTYNKAKVVVDNDERTYLGEISIRYTSGSIFNEHGTYGSKYSSGSINNEHGSYGGKYSSLSPFNRFSSSPPLIIKNNCLIGKLTVNKTLTGAVDPNLLKQHFSN